MTMNNAAELISRWAAGPSYGPVLSQTDLYLLGNHLELHPILRGKGEDPFHLNFNLQSGEVGGFNAEERDRDLDFLRKHEPATLPRVSQLYIISHISPWCHTVQNEYGVTMEDICNKLTEDFTQPITEGEMMSLPPRYQDYINRAATLRHSSYGTAYYGQPTMGAIPQKLRIDWLRDRRFFDSLFQDHEYIKRRLGFSAPNIFILALSA